MLPTKMSNESQQDFFKGRGEKLFQERAIQNREVSGDEFYMFLTHFFVPNSPQKTTPPPKPLSGQQVSKCASQASIENSAAAWGMIWSGDIENREKVKSPPRPLLQSKLLHPRVAFFFSFSKQPSGFMSFQVHLVMPSEMSHLLPCPIQPKSQGTLQSHPHLEHILALQTLQCDFNGSCQEMGCI